MTSPLDVYILACTEQNVKKPNSAVVELLSNQEVAAGVRTSLSFDGTVLGPKGFHAVLAVLPLYPQLKSLCFRETAIYSLDWCSNEAGNHAIEHLAELLTRDLPHMTSLDLRGNPLGTVAGRILLDLISAPCVSITEMMFDPDGVDRHVVKAIQSRLEMNARRKEKAEAVKQKAAALAHSKAQRMQKSLDAVMARCGVRDLPPPSAWEEHHWEGLWSLDSGNVCILCSGSLTSSESEVALFEIVIGPCTLETTEGATAMVLEGTTPQLDERKHLAATYFLSLGAAQHLTLSQRARLALTSRLAEYGPGDILRDIPCDVVVCVVSGCVIVETVRGEELQNIELGEVFVMSSDSHLVLRARSNVVVALVHESRLL